MKSFIQFLTENDASEIPNPTTTPAMTPVHSSAAGANKDWTQGYNMDSVHAELEKAGFGTYKDRNNFVVNNFQQDGIAKTFPTPTGTLHVNSGLDSTGRNAVHSLGFVPTATPAAAPAASGTPSRAAPTAAPAVSGTPAGYPEGYISSRYAQVQKQFPNMDHAERMRTIHWNDKTMNPTKLAQLQSYNKTMGPPPIPGSPTIKPGISKGLAGFGAAALGGVVSGALGAGTNAAAAAYQHRTTDEKMPMEKSMQSDMGLMWDKVPGESGELQGNPAGFKAAKDREKKTGVPYPTYHDWSN